jgi:hypothetical protein
MKHLQFIDDKIQAIGEKIHNVALQKAKLNSKFSLNTFKDKLREVNERHKKRHVFQMLGSIENLTDTAQKIWQMDFSKMQKSIDDQYQQNLNLDNVLVLQQHGVSFFLKDINAEILAI